MTHLCELCKQAPLVPAPTWIPALKRKPAVSGTYRVRFFTGVEGKLYWNAEAGCWQRTSAPAKQRNVHRHVQHLMDSNNAAWLEQSSKEGSTHKSSQIPTGEYDHDVERIRVMNAECEAAVCYPPEGIGRKRNPKGVGE